MLKHVLRLIVCTRSVSCVKSTQNLLGLSFVECSMFNLGLI